MNAVVDENHLEKKNPWDPSSHLLLEISADDVVEVAVVDGTDEKTGDSSDEWNDDEVDGDDASVVAVDGDVDDGGGI